MAMHDHSVAEQLLRANGLDSDPQERVSIIVPAYNEASIIQENLSQVYQYMVDHRAEYRWELIVVDDGSQDGTGQLADDFAAQKGNVKVHHHLINLNLGTALRSGFKLAQGDVIIVLDIDLSYSLDHIPRMLQALEENQADVVVASPYMKGGRTTQVPRKRLVLSRAINRIIRGVSSYRLHTFTGMVRAYRADFIRTLNLKSSDYQISAEIIYKAAILRSRVIEIPAHLDWSLQNSQQHRTSSMRLLKGVMSGFMTAFIFRPYAFFLSLGSIFFLVALYMIGWIVYHTYQIYPSISVPSGLINDQFSEAVGAVFQARPHAFFVSGITLIVGIQILSIGFLSLQKKRYFDEHFSISSALLRKLNRQE